MGRRDLQILQRDVIEMKPKLTKKGIVILVAIIAAIAFFVRVPRAAIMVSGFLTAIFALVFTVTTLLPISDVLLLTFIGFGALTAWALYKRDLKPVLFPGSLLALPALVAGVSMMISPALEWYFGFLLFMPFSVIMLSLFVGLGAIVVSPSCRQDVSRVLRLIAYTFGAIVLSLLFQLLMLVLWALVLHLVPHGTDIVTALVIAYLYWPGKKRGLLLEVLGPILALELALLLISGLIV